MKNTFITLLFFSLCLFTTAQNTPSQAAVVDFKNAQVDLFLNENSNIVSGTVSYDFTILRDTDSIFIDAKNLSRYSAKLDGATVNSNYDLEKIVVKSRFRESENHTILLEFSTDPTSALYHIDSNADGKWDQLWTQGQGKYTSNWLPSIDDMNDKIIWDITVTAPKDLTIIANGTLKKTELIDATKKWRFDMAQPMSSYLVALVAGTYDVRELTSKSGTPINLYYYPSDVKKVDATYAYSKEIFDFLEAEIGIPYPWETYKQVPVKDFLYSGMENTSLTIFSDEFVNDELGAIDRPYVNVNAHELAHQWFGNLVTEQSSLDHWLHEGFATYYAMQAERKLYGDNYYYMQLFNNAESLYEQTKAGNATALLAEKGSSLTYYEHGAWALHALHDLVGDRAFKQSVKTFLTTYAFKNVTTKNFLAIVATTSSKDLSTFKATWLTNTAFPLAESLTLLRKSPFMETYLQLSARRTSNFDEARRSYEEVLQAAPNRFLLQELVTQLNLHNEPRAHELLKRAARSNDLLVRQTIALTTPEITATNKVLIEELLNDASYVTREQALFLLWESNSTKRKELLTQVKNTWKTTNESLEMAQAALALNTPEFSNEELRGFMATIQQFTGSQHSIATRTAAFDYLINMGIMNEQNYKDLVTAALHHNWRFYTSARDLLKTQYKREQEQALIESAIKRRSKKDQERLYGFLGI